MLPRSLRAAAALAGVASAAAQQSGFVWGTSGSWQQIVPTPDASGNVAQPAVAYQHAAFVPGTLLLTGNTTAVTPGSMDLYKYNIVMNTWSAPFDFVPNPAVQIPFLFTYGGLAVIADEAQPNVMNMIDQSMPSGAWTKISVANAPLGRVAMRFVVWGSQLYFFGGVNLLNGNAVSNDLWSLDLTTSVTNPTGSNAWAQISPQADPTTGIIAGYPFPRVAYSFTAYQVGAVMYGGISSPAGTDPFATCIFNPSPTPNPGCFFHQNVWALLPGQFVPPSAALGPNYPSGQMPPSAWVRLGENGVSPGAVPDGRALHTAGAMGDNLFVYGGITAKGPSNELWAYNLMSQAWGLVTSVGPQPPRGAGFGVGCIVGFH